MTGAALRVENLGIEGAVLDVRSDNGVQASVFRMR